MMKMSNRAAALCLSAAVLIGSVPWTAFPVRAEGEVIVIRSAEDFIQFGKACTAESFSEGKIVRLEADIDLSGQEYSPVPVFGGTFEGNGHTISGINISQSGSNLGLFRYLTEDAVVQELHVQGELKPDGSKKKIGGIAGTNRGTIRGCSFSGTGEALEQLGGIAGINEESGVIEDCRNAAELTGNRQIGGIAGENAGMIVNSHNEGEINTSSEGIEENSEGTNKISLDRESIRNTVMDEKVNDVGGIAGLSTGTIRQCGNTGQIGYEHAGYNIGGIAGRQNGLLILCENEGTVTGRKDVGGIAGQLEPFLTIEYGKDTFDRINDQVDRISDTTDVMTQQLRDTTDASIGNLDRVDEIVKEIKNLTRNKKDDRRIKRDEFWEKADRQLDLIDEILANMEFDLGSRSAERAASRIRSNVKRSKELLNGLENVGADGLPEGIPENILGDATESISGNLPEEVTGNIPENILDSIPESGDISAAVGSAVGSMIGGGVTMPDDFIFDEDAGVLGELQYLYEVLTELQGCAEDITKDTGIMIEDGIGGVIDGVRDLEDDLDCLRIESKELLDLTRDYKDQLIEDIDGLDEDLTGQLDQLYDELDSLSDHLKAGKDNLRGEKDQLDVQLDEMQDIIMEGKDRVQEERDKLEDDPESLFEDVSEQATELSNGMVIGCANRGAVFSDLQAGGVIGTIGVEVGFDPDEDIETYGDESLYMTRYAQAAVRECRNDGDITVKRDYAGGIAGSARVGALVSNQNYGDVSAEDGDYVGGIAGISQSTVSGSYTMCEVSGNDYVGGITGWGKNLKDNCAMVNVVTDGGEWLGSISGDRDEDGTVSSNRYVDDGLGAVDGVTFRGEAEGITYDTLLQLEGLPEEFCSMTVTFLADEQIVEQVICEYGQSLAAEAMPEIPKKEGFFEYWEHVDLSDIRRNYKVNAVYVPWTTTIAATDEPMSPMLAEAQFHSEAVLSIQELGTADLKAAGISDPSGSKMVKAYRYETSDPKNPEPSETVKLHVLAKGADGVGIVQDGRIVKADAVQDGEYLIFEAAANGEIVLLKSNPVWGIAVVAAIVAVAGVLLSRKRKAAGGKGENAEGGRKKR